MPPARSWPPCRAALRRGSAYLAARKCVVEWDNVRKLRNFPLLRSPRNLCKLLSVKHVWLLSLISVSAVTLPASAEAPRKIAVASIVVQQAAAALVAERAQPIRSDRTPEQSELPLTLSAETQAALAELGASPAGAESGQRRSEASRKSCSLGESCSYSSLLGSLVITRDLQIPGAPTMAVRLIPTARALSGETSPVVLRPRVAGAGSSWYGVDVAARF
jgi:hypothetical protein